MRTYTFTNKFKVQNICRFEQLITSMGAKLDVEEIDDILFAEDQKDKKRCPKVSFRGYSINLNSVVTDMINGEIIKSDVISSIKSELHHNEKVKLITMGDNDLGYFVSIIEITNESINKDVIRGIEAMKLSCLMKKKYKIEL